MHCAHSLFLIYFPTMLMPGLMTPESQVDSSDRMGGQYRLSAGEAPRCLEKPESRTWQGRSPRENRSL